MALTWCRHHVCSRGGDLGHCRVFKRGLWFHELCWVLRKRIAQTGNHRLIAWNFIGTPPRRPCRDRRIHSACLRGRVTRCQVTLRQCGTVFFGWCHNTVRVASGFRKRGAIGVKMGLGNSRRGRRHRNRFCVCGGGLPMNGFTLQAGGGASLGVCAAWGATYLQIRRGGALRMGRGCCGFQIRRQPQHGPSGGTTRTHLCFPNLRLLSIFLLFSLRLGGLCLMMR
mmetsp:Transcript_61145/g.177287  ORF Transcript_61145/g.177287 Transcript_61145/m.177287 type:complete len:225 (-) Transcript_61145:1079-1753(-)